MYVVIYIVTVYNSNNVMVDVNLYVTNKVAKGSIGTETAAMRGLAIHSVITGGYNSGYLYYYGDLLQRNN